MPYKRNIKVEFNCLSGEATNEVSPDKKPTGNMHHINGYNIALYLQDGQLKLQINSQIWIFASKELKISFYHDVLQRTSHFSITSPQGDFTLEYPAWWSEMPDFEPFEPEMDKDEDYLAYIYEVWQQPTIQNALQKRWSI